MKECKTCHELRGDEFYIDDRFEQCLRCYYPQAKLFTHVSVSCNIPTLTRKNENGSRVYYDQNDNRYESVTHVVGHEDDLTRWRESVGYDVADYISRRATTLGSKLHEMVERHLLNKTQTERHLFANAHFNNIRPLVNKIDNIHGVELRLCSKNLGLAGTADCIADFNGKLSIIDFKTSSKKKKEEWIQKYFWQATAYSLMFEELTNKKAKQIVILMTAEDGTLEEFIRDRDDYVQELYDVIERFNNR